MVPGKYNMICPQGTTFTKQLTWTVDDIPVDLTTYTARMQVREKYTSPTTVINLNSQNITLGGDEGTILITISSDVTTAVFPKEYVYDLELVSSSVVTRLLEGKFIVTPEVTR